MRRFVFASALAVAGCGLIGNDVTTVTVSLPARDFRIDSADWRLPAGNVPDFPCATDCTAFQDAVCTQQNCTAECASDQHCVAKVPVSLKNDFDLSKDSPSYQQVANLPVVEVQLQSVTFNITENTLNIDTPELLVYFGPTSITSPSDAAAELVGTIPSVPQGFMGVLPVAFSAAGQAVVKKYMDDYRTPFRVLVYSVVVVRSGPTPSGRLVGQVTATATVGLNL
jgi:hypothetical protein